MNSVAFMQVPTVNVFINKTNANGKYAPLAAVS
jgi:hypothetical protein